MKNKRRNRVLTGLFLLSFLILFTSGCDKYTRHKVLTFFFTGVPHPDEEKKVPGVPIVKKIKGKPVPEVAFFAHGPHAAKQCYHCHNMPTTFGFRKTGEKKKTGGIPSLGGQNPGLLVTPPEDLCIECHTSKSAQSAHSKDLWSHGPVANGKCIVCHDPHQNVNIYMLLKKPEEICIQCHSKGYVIKTAIHKDLGDCLSCHNAHFGKDRLLLKKDYKEVF